MSSFMKAQRVSLLIGSFERYRESSEKVFSEVWGRFVPDLCRTEAVAAVFMLTMRQKIIA
jgi:hypothetical protein